ncbi:MAG: recombination protein RecR [Candidatus Taylorbacteria bacterium]|nr:recombination protein RecR [Candidatus Taylorbacteria bacterium]
MDTSDKLEEIFRNFPGIGPRQAKRFVYHLLTKSQNELSEFSTLLTQLKSTVFICPSCFRFHTQKYALDQSGLCSICRDQNRNHRQLMIVARDIDVGALEKSRAYSGRYFVLGGTVPILDNDPASKIRQKELLQLLTDKEFDEIIIATSINPESEHTATYILSLLKKHYENSKLPKVTTPGRGLSTGTELEYSDADTLRSALENRR